MSKNLVIVESPAKAKTISKYLGSDFIVESSVGHIRDLPKKAPANSKRASIPKDVSPEEKIRLKSINDRNRLIRRMGIDPDNGWKAEWQIIPEKEKVIKSLRKAAKGVERIYLATDLDREGEAIAWHLKEALGPEKYEYSRVRFNQITKTSIVDSFNDPKEIDLDLVKAYRARRFLDKVIGFELSPLLWKKIARGLSAGRVQSVALRILDERERLIQEFIPEEFWEVSISLSKDSLNIPFNLNRKKSDPLLKEEEAKNIETLIRNSNLLIDEIVKKPIKTKPRPPFITSTLQQAASTRLSFNVKRTMRVAQKLYEGGYITYMRTDAPSLSKESIADARNFINEKIGNKYLTTNPRIYSSTENAQEAHEAIRPTNAYVTADDLLSQSDEEKKLYQLIWQRYIACQMPDAEYLSTSAKINVDEYSFVAKGREVVFDGYTKIHQSSKAETDDILPPLQEGETLSLNEINLDQKFTKPPSRYSEAALVKELEKKGIGRPSTYASIIEKVQERKYILKTNIKGTEKEVTNYLIKQGNDNVIEEKTKVTLNESKNKMISTELGKRVNSYLSKHFTDIILNYDFTSNLEKDLDLVLNGTVNYIDLLKNFYKDFIIIYNKLIMEGQKFNKEFDNGRLVGNHPQTNEPIYVRIAKYGPVAQIGEYTKGKKLQFIKLSEDNLDTITIDDILEKMKYPKNLGDYNGSKIELADKRYGFCICYNGNYYSLYQNEKDDLDSIDREKAIEIIQRKTKKKALKVLMNGRAELLEGPYGKYVRYVKRNGDEINLKIPKAIDINSINDDFIKRLLKDK